MKIRFYLLTCASIILLTVNAQNKQDIRKILDETAGTISKGGVKATFKATLFNNIKEKGETEGVILLKGKNFQVTTDRSITWFDGKTQWTYVKSNNEVNISKPTNEQLQRINPYRFINLYKEGYNYAMKSTTLRGITVYEIQLTAQHKEQNIQEIILSIDKNDKQPLCIRMLHDGQWTRISIKEMTTKYKTHDRDFKFNQKDFPKAELIDLR